MTMVHCVLEAVRSDNIKEHQTCAFEAWIESEEIRALIATIPSTGDNEVFQTILRSAHKAGFSSGHGMMVMALAKDILTSNSRS